MDLLRALDNEWLTVSTTPTASLRFARWQHESACLKAVPTLDALVATAQRRDDPGRSDRILAELARRSPADDLAARTLLQSLMPAVRSMVAEHYRLAEYNDVVATAVAVMWERIRTYPIERRPRAIAANIVLDSRRELRRRHLAPPLPLCVDHPREIPTSDDAAIQFVDALDAAHRLLDHDSLTLLIRTRGNGETIASIARDTHQSPNALRERRRRAERRLRLALAVR